MAIGEPPFTLHRHVDWQMRICTFDLRQVFRKTSIFLWISQEMLSFSSLSNHGKSLETDETSWWWIKSFFVSFLTDESDLNIKSMHRQWIKIHNLRFDLSTLLQFEAYRLISLLFVWKESIAKSTNKWRWKIFTSSNDFAINANHIDHICCCLSFRAYLFQKVCCEAHIQMAK